MVAAINLTSIALSFVITDIFDSNRSAIALCLTDQEAYFKTSGQWFTLVEGATASEATSYQEFVAQTLVEVVPMQLSTKLKDWVCVQSTHTINE